MKFLGIDYGRKKVGLALSEGKLAEPYKVVRYKDRESLKTVIKKIVENEKIEKIVVGISENEMGRESKDFAREINAETYDETLTSYDATTLSIQGGVKRKRRKEMEDAYAATIMLQNYIDQSSVAK